MNTATYIVAALALLGCVGFWMLIRNSERAERQHRRWVGTGEVIDVRETPDTTATGTSHVTVIKDRAEHARREADKRRGGGGEAA